jgi:hypothetical protein
MTENRSNQSSDKINIFAVFLFALFCLFSIGQTDAAIVFCLVTILLLPSILLSLSSSYFGIKFFTITIALTQIIGVPYFIIKKDSYEHDGWLAVRDFKFSFLEFFNIYLSIGILLFSVVGIFFIINHFFPLPSIASVSVENKEIKPINQGKDSTFLIAALIIFLIPINITMFFFRIGLVGIEPTILPFKMSGILVYFTRYIAPIFILRIYAKSSRKIQSSLTILFYAMILGMSQISRTANIVMLFPVIFYSILDKNKRLLIISSMWSLLCFQASSSIRDFVYSTEKNRLFGDVLMDLSSVIDDIDWSQIFFVMLGRLESPQWVALASQVNPSFMGSPWLMIQRIIWQEGTYFDTDLYHLEWIGITLPYGFYAGGGLLSNSIPIMNSGLMFAFIIFSIISIYIYIGEWMIRRIALKYESTVLYYTLICLYTSLFLIGVGTFVFMCYFTLLIIMLLLKKRKFSVY